MWTLCGPFDGETGDVSFQSKYLCTFLYLSALTILAESKLLKTGTTYGLGRKDCPLIVANKKVSSHHCDFEVKAFSGDAAGDPTQEPVLEFHNTKDKPMRIARDQKQIGVNAHETIELRDGDIVAIISGVLIHYTAQPIIAASLLSAAQFAKLEWLTEVLRLGSLPKGSKEVSLEDTFELPPLSKYRPAYSPALPTSQKEYRVWEPNEERLGFFSSYRFLYVDEKNRIGDYKEVIERGGGSFEIFEAATGKSKFHRALTRGQAKEGKTQIVVGKSKSIIAAIGKERWKELVEEAKSFGLHIVDPEIIVQVVINLDTSLFSTPPPPDVDDDEFIQSSSIPDFIPNTHSDEPSMPPPELEQQAAPPRRLLRRATSHQASQEPAAVLKTPEPEPEAAPRKAYSGKPLVIGLDDPSMIIDAPPDISAIAPPQPAEDVPPPSQAPRSSRLKRRAGGAAAFDAGASQTIGYTVQEPTEEPPLKKFKALFEASGQENVESGTFGSSTFDEHTPASTSQTQNESQTQGTRSRSGRTAATNLSTLREEEEETQGSVVAARGTKRSHDIDEDVDMGDSQNQPAAGPSLVKKRAIESINAVQQAPVAAGPSDPRASSKPPSSAQIKTHKAGALPGKPDQDAKFLKAIASTKKGKKTEDDFDRDFNKLKITKPALEREEPEEQWALVADFGDDTNVRGNFMVVVEMPAYNRGRKGQVDEIREEWQGKTNYKKFRKDKKDAKRDIRELFATDNNYGMGPMYWPEGKSQGQSREDFGPSQVKAGGKGEGRAQTQTGKSQAPLVIDDSDEEIAPIRKAKSKASSRANSTAQTKRTATRSKPPAKSQQLFLDDDDDDDDDDVIQSFTSADNEVPEDSDEEQTLRSTRTSMRNTQKPPTRAARKPAPILVDDDSDDGAVFKGFKGKTRRR
ncbi:hypothetical protein DXG01_003419 [Tephrocybe rancida]|nr:hypothetical protein DXG01_003419 [Tephrocybe rancida]